MKNNILGMIIIILFSFSADATIRFDTRQVDLLTSAMPQELMSPSPRKKIPFPKTPSVLSHELCRQFLQGHVKVDRLVNHRLFQLDEQAFENQVKFLDARLYSDPASTELDRQRDKALRDLKCARNLRHNLNGAWKDVKKGVIQKKHPRHIRDIQGSLFESPFKKAPVEKVPDTKHQRINARKNNLS